MANTASESEPGALLGAPGSRQDSISARQARWIVDRGWIIAQDVERALDQVGDGDLLDLLFERGLINAQQNDEAHRATEFAQDRAPTVPLAVHRAASAAGAFAQGAQVARSQTDTRPLGARPSSRVTDFVNPVTPGQRIGNYLVIDEISRGGMGVVVRARDVRLDVERALKFLLNPCPTVEEVRRFEREARVLAALDHPHVLSLLDFGVEGNLMYFSMELIEGQDLQFLTDENFRSFQSAPAFEWVAKVAASMASALAYCHSLDVVHRDVKPQNVLVETATQRPVLCDFGLTKRLSSNGDTTGQSFSKSGTIWGTPIYMSPEQLCARGEFGEVGPATDIWSLGATLFYAVTQQPPYAEAELVDLYHAVKREDPRDPQRLNPKIPDWFAKLIRGCLQRPQEARLPLAELASKIEAEIGAQFLPPFPSTGLPPRVIESSAPSAGCLWSWIPAALRPARKGHESVS